jgi:hypothetical protein
MAASAVVARQTEVQADGLGVTDVQEPVRFGWEAGTDPAVVLAGPEIFFDDGAQKI